MKKIITLLQLFLFSIGISQNIIETTLRCKSKNYYANKAYGQGTDELEYKRYKNAVSYLEYAVKLDTAFCDAWNNLGIAHRMLSNWNKSYWCFVHSVYWDSTYHTGWMNLAEHFFLVKDTGNTISSVRNLLRNSPNNYYGIVGLGKFYCKLGNYDSSMVYLNKALKIRKETEVYLYKAYVFYGRKKYPEFKHMADSIYTDVKKDAVLNYYLGEYYEKENNKEKSEKYFKIAAKRGLVKPISK